MSDCKDILESLFAIFQIIALAFAGAGGMLAVYMDLDNKIKQNEKQLKELRQAQRAEVRAMKDLDESLARSYY